MTDHWNFHNYVAIPLEKLTSKDYSADEIETGAFVEAMLSVLSADAQNLPLYATFFSKCNTLLGKKKSEIPDEDAAALFEAFKLIIEKRKDVML
ncbi:MAG: hypothetical protein E7461_04885 [Ruminococcaceae bacterium]|nr:hypothetical protein [Oscillospiraceae bacterium]